MANNILKRIALLTSGGDAPGMNAAVRAVVRTSVFNSIECFAIYKGFQGLINNEIKLINARGVNNIINRGGTVLKSARCIEFKTKNGRLKAFKNLKEKKNRCPCYNRW